MFCHKCGVKLELDNVRPPRVAGKTRGGRLGKSILDLVGLAIRILVFVGLALAIILLLQVPTPREIKPSDIEVAKSYTKRLELTRIIQQKKAGTITLSEAEINSCIAQVTSDRNNLHLNIQPMTVQIELGQGDVAVVVVGKIKFGTLFEKWVAFRYMGVPTIEGNRFVFHATGGYIGRLPIHPKILEYTGLLDRYYAQVFRSLSADRELLNNLAAISVNPNNGVELKYDPAQHR
jgi:hypothetical protein